MVKEGGGDLSVESRTDPGFTMVFEPTLLCLRRLKTMEPRPDGLSDPRVQPLPDTSSQVESVQGPPKRQRLTA